MIKTQTKPHSSKRLTSKSQYGLGVGVVSGLPPKTEARVPELSSRLFHKLLYPDLGNQN